MRSVLLKAGNLLFYLVTCALIGTGLLLEFRLEEDSAGRILGMGGEDWSETHLILALACIGLGVLHLILNWSWIKGVASGNRLALASGALLAGLLLAIGPLLAPARGAASCVETEVERSELEEEQLAAAKDGTGGRNGLQHKSGKDKDCED